MEIINSCFKKFGKNIKDKSVDAIITDPPYNIVHKSTKLKFKTRADFGLEAEFDKSNLDIKGFCDLSKRVLKPDGNLFIFCAPQQVGLYFNELQSFFESFNQFAWIKTNPPPKVRKKGFLNAVELAIVFYNKASKFNFYLPQSKMSNAFFILLSRAQKELHIPHKSH